LFFVSDQGRKIYNQKKHPQFSKFDEFVFCTSSSLDMANEAAEAAKAEGNACLQKSDTAGAIAAYTKAINVSLALRGRRTVDEEIHL
jgi:predicted negative regulator of RcsB-dependent stress response